MESRRFSADRGRAQPDDGPDSGAGPFYFVYLVVAKGDSMSGVAGVQCGLAYDYCYGFQTNGASNRMGLDIFSWTLCATMEFPTPGLAWPNPLSGNLITWDWTTDCQTGELANAGYFYCAAYSTDLMAIIPRPVDGKAAVADCQAVESPPISPALLGFAGFGVPGCNPCSQFCLEHGVLCPVENTTWGAIKSRPR